MHSTLLFTGNERKSKNDHALFRSKDGFQASRYGFETPGKREKNSSFIQSINKSIIMEKNIFDPGSIFRFNESVDYSDGGIVSKTVLKKQTGNISLFSFAKVEALSEHTAPFDAMIQVVD